MNTQTSTPRRPRKRCWRRSSSPTAKGIPRLLPEHLLLTLLEQKDGIVPEIVRKMNADPATSRHGRPRGAGERCRARTAARRLALSARLRQVLTPPSRKRSG